MLLGLRPRPRGRGPGAPCNITFLERKLQRIQLHMNSKLFWCKAGGLGRAPPQATQRNTFMVERAPRGPWFHINYNGTLRCLGINDGIHHYNTGYRDPLPPKGGKGPILAPQGKGPLPKGPRRESRGEFSLEKRGQHAPCKASSLASIMRGVT